jgi:VWFA-related protein
MRALSSLMLALAAVVSLGAQSPFDSARGEAASVAQDKPQTGFRAGVELITVEASVLDANGQPVPDLGAVDFEVTVAGRPRSVRSVRFHGGAVTPAERAAAAPLIPAVATNRAEDGRIVVFVVDRDSIPQGERALIEAAASIVDSLGPADASGIFEVPGAGLSLTREHDRVKAALRRLTGARPPLLYTRARDIRWDEALAFDQGNQFIIDEVTQRECYMLPEPRDGSGLTNQCPRQLRAQAMEMVLTGRMRVQTVMSNLSSLAGQLAALRGPKQIVFLSSGLPFGQDLLHWYNEFAQKAAEAELVLRVVHFDPPEVDLAASGQTVSSPFGGRDLASGLGAIAGTTGGAFYTTGGSGAGIFERIKTEMGNFYELAVEAEPGDEAGKALPIEVKVRRNGLSVRARRSIVPPVRSAAPLTERVGALLRQPTDIAELPLAVTSYTMRGDDPSVLRVVIAAEVGAERFTAPAEWSFAAFHEGNMIATGQQALNAAGAAPWPGAMAAKLLPGRYRLRVAAADAEGRAGVIDVPLTVGLRAAGTLQISDLLLGVAVSGRLQPQSRIASGMALSSMLEVVAADAAVVERARTIIEILPAGSAEPVKRFQMAMRSDIPTMAVHQANMATAGLAPGRYTAAATVMLDDEAVGRVSRVFEILAK